MLFDLCFLGLYRDFQAPSVGASVMRIGFWGVCMLSSEESKGKGVLFVGRKQNPRLLETALQ